MNSYKLTTYKYTKVFNNGTTSIPNTGDPIDQVILLEDEMEGYLKAVSYLVLFGDNVQMVPSFFRFAQIATPTTTSSPNTDILADLDFSLSNVELGTENVIPVTYDTTAQSVREFVDKPYAMKGYNVAVFVPADVVAPTKDLDDFIRYPIAYVGMRDSGGDNDWILKTGHIYLGTCNASKTDFYTPFSTEGLQTVFFDGKQALAKVANNDIAAAVASNLQNYGMNPTSAQLNQAIATSVKPTIKLGGAKLW